MKILFFLNMITLSFLVLHPSWCQESKHPPVAADRVTADGSSNIYLYNKFDMTIIPVEDPFEFIYVPTDVGPVQEIAEKGRYRFVINGSFFEGSRLNARHAGWLSITGQDFTPIMKDAQLSHVVIYNLDNLRVEFVDYRQFRPGENASVIAFQTGPIVIEKNRVTENYIKASINGSGRYTRTLLGAADSKLIFLITVRKPVNLIELAEYLLSLSLFEKHKLDVVNLDGGPSVALYVKNHPEFNYNVNDRLPILLGVK